MKILCYFVISFSNEVSYITPWHFLNSVKRCVTRR